MAEQDARLETVRGDLRAEIAQLRTEMHTLGNKLLGSMIAIAAVAVAATGIMLAVFA